jgi:ADP-ribosylglycohydrolase
LYNILYENMELESALDIAARATNDAFINQKLTAAKRKVAEVGDCSSSLSKEEFADDIALTSMARLWDVGKTEPIKVGKASPAEGALPGALFFSIRYKHSLEKALIANANCGGDSAARGIVIGMLLGAVHGPAAIPSRWQEGLRSLNHVKKQISVIRSNIKTEL